MLDALDRGKATEISTRRIGPALAFERVWEETGCRGVIERLARARKHDFSLERAAFLTVLHRLFCGGSDRAADRWREDYRIDGVEGLELHHLYRAMAWLGEELSEEEQDGATPFARRCVKDVLEEDLFASRRDLLTTLDVVFMDTTSLLFRGRGRRDARATRLLQGSSARSQPDDPGRAPRWRRPPGVHGDVAGKHGRREQPDPGGRSPAAPLPHQPRLRRRRSRHDQRRDDRRTRRARGLLYVLGVRERTDKLVRELVLDDPAPFVPFVLMKERREVDYEAKAVKLAGRRFIVCRNLDEMSKDAANRATIVAALERQLRKGDKSLVGNKGYRRFLANPQGDGFAIDRAKVEEDARFDGVFVLQTNAHLSPLEAMLVYKQLWTVERTFRTAKDLLETRPIYHQLDETIRGHVACSFLALVLKKELEDRLAAAGNGARASWPAVIADLDSLTETEVEQDGKRFLLRSAPRPAASLALAALGVALPPTLRQIRDA